MSGGGEARQAPLRAALRRHGAGLVCAVTALELTGLGVQLAGANRSLPWLTMDEPTALARFAVAAVLLGGSVVGFLGCVRRPARRSWWLLVALVLLIASAVKAGGVVHADLLDRSGLRERPALSALLSGCIAGAVLATMWWASRHERRDRRRVLGSLAAYAFAATGLSAISAAVSQTSGADAVLTALAVFVEEEGEAIAAVLVLFAVLVGVVPGRVLGPGFPSRRDGDAQSCPHVPSSTNQLIGGQ